VIPIGEHSAFAAERAVHTPCDADEEALETPREGAPVAGLADEVQMVGLHRVLDDAHREANHSRTARRLARRDSQSRRLSVWIAPMRAVTWTG